MVVFLGSNPSQSSISCEPFAEGKSAKVLQHWISYLGLQPGEYKCLNVCNYKTENNRPLSQREIIMSVPALLPQLNECFIVCLGKTAHRACHWLEDAQAFDTKVPVKDRCAWGRYTKFEHPSGLNRNLNDPKRVKSGLEKLKKDIEGFYVMKFVRVYGVLMNDEEYKAGFDEV